MTKKYWINDMMYTTDINSVPNKRIVCKNGLVFDDRQRQLDVIKSVLDVDTCLSCGFEALFFYHVNGQGLCPHCDKEIIEDFKEGE